MSIKKPAVRENGNNQAAAKAAIAKQATESGVFMVRRLHAEGSDGLIIAYPQPVCTDSPWLFKVFFQTA